MPTTLTVRNVPPSLHARLKRRAKEHRRSLNSEVLAVLEEAVGEKATDRESLIDRIKQRRAALPTMTWGPEELKRQMREGLA
ncbi:MAG: Arc family DNA-binding protein [Bacteroidetes bacterium]|jgi:plasmid stability protein|nr:Arc family DNA-binding protein [Bacteroidota bacterium]